MNTNYNFKKNCKCKSKPEEKIDFGLQINYPCYEKVTLRGSASTISLTTKIQRNSHYFGFKCYKKKYVDSNSYLVNRGLSYTNTNTVIPSSLLVYPSSSSFSSSSSSSFPLYRIPYTSVAPVFTITSSVFSDPTLTPEILETLQPFNIDAPVIYSNDQQYFNSLKTQDFISSIQPANVGVPF